MAKSWVGVNPRKLTGKQSSDKAAWEHKTKERLLRKNPKMAEKALERRIKLANADEVIEKCGISDKTATFNIRKLFTSSDTKEIRSIIKNLAKTNNPKLIQFL